MYQGNPCTIMGYCWTISVPNNCLKIWVHNSILLFVKQQCAILGCCRMYPSNSILRVMGPGLGLPTMPPGPRRNKTFMGHREILMANYMIIFSRLYRYQGEEFGDKSTTCTFADYFNLFIKRKRFSNTYRELNFLFSEMKVQV